MYVDALEAARGERGVDDRVKRRAWAHRLRRKKGVRVPVAADVRLLSLGSEELSQDPRLVVPQLRVDRREPEVGIIRGESKKSTITSWKKS